MITLYDASVVLVAAGSSVGVSLLWLRRQSRLHRQSMDTLLALRSELHADLLGTLASQTTILSSLGLDRLTWQGHWYGTPVQTPAANAALKPPIASQELVHQFNYEDVQLTFHLDLRGLRGERKLFALQAAHVLFAMVEGALAAKELALLAAVNQRARVGVFLQHDMRNLTQWVQLVAEDFEMAQSDAALLSLAKRMRSNADLTTRRAQRMGQALLNPAWQPSSFAPDNSADLQQIDLALYVQEAAQMHQVQVDIHGEGTALWDSSVLACVLDNVLGNVSHIARQHLLAAHCTVRIEEDADGYQIRFETPQLPLRIALEKLFEPWSSSGDVNRGLGLYQARKQTLAAQGQLHAQRLGDGIAVILRIKKPGY